MNLKKIFYGIATASVIVAPITATIACGSRDRGKFVQLVTDGSPIEDKSFNEQARDAAKDWGGKNDKSWGAIQAKSATSSDITSAFQAAIDAGTKALITTGYGLDKPLIAFADKNKDKKFVYVDGTIDGHDNVIALTYKTEGAAYLAGIATGIMLNLNYDRFKDDGLVVGAWGGQDIPPMWSFMGGFQQGLAYFNANMAIDSDHMIKYVMPGSNRASMFSGNYDAGGGSAIANALLKTGKADVIMGVAGTQSNDGVSAIKNSKSKSLVIGVDTDQTITLGNDGKYAFTSIMKDVYKTVTEALNVAVNGAKNDLIRLGHTANAGLADGFVKLANGIINKVTNQDAGYSGKIKVGITSTDATKFKSGSTEGWSLTATAKSIYDIANLKIYKDEAIKAQGHLWSGFKGVANGVAQVFDMTAAKAEEG